MKNQQYSTALGGPIIKDKLHYFANYEYEREPRTSIFNSPYPAFNVNLTGKNTQQKGGIRLDYQLSTQTRLMGKFSRAVIFEPFGAGNTGFSGSTGTNREYNRESLGQLTRVLSNRAVNEVKVGQAVFGLANQNLTTWSNHWQKVNGITIGSPRIAFTGFSIAPNQNYPRHQDQWVWNARDDFTYSYDAGGRHDLRLGGEFLNRHQIQDNCRQCSGDMRATALPLPSAAVLQSWFPDPFNVDTWNLAAVSPWVTTYLDRRRRLQRPSLFEEDRELVPGRLGDQQPADVEPRRALRPRARRVRQRRVGAAVPAGRAVPPTRPTSSRDSASTSR